MIVRLLRQVNSTIKNINITTVYFGIAGNTITKKQLKVG